MTAGPPCTAEQEATRSRCGVPRFAGVRPTNGGQWQAFIKIDGRWELIGTYDTPRLAWWAYKRSRPKVRAERESTAAVERLLAISAGFPVRFEVEGSLMRSSMDSTLKNWQDAMLDRGGVIL